MMRYDESFLSKQYNERRVRSDATAVYVSKERYKLVVSSDTKAPLGNTEENILASVTAHNPILFAHTKPFS